MAIPFLDQIKAAAAKYRLDPALLAGLIKQESGFNPNARSGVGASGLTQLMPATAAALGVSNPNDPAQAIDGGARYLRQQLDTFGGDVPKALAAYNAGPGNVKKYGGIPPFTETQNYVRSVQGYADAFRRDGLEGSTADASTPAPDTSGTAAAAASGGGLLDPLLNGAVKGLVWISLILGGAALFIVGAGRIAGAGSEATA